MSHQPKMATRRRRITQRAPLSCLPCSKRKMKCSRTIPCSSCERRKIPEQCARESVLLSKHVTRWQCPSSDSHVPTNTVNLEDSPSQGSAEMLAASSRTQASTPGDARQDSSEPAFFSNTTADSRQSSAGPASPANEQPAQVPRRRKARLAMEALNNLESLTWGSHEATVEIHADRNRAAGLSGSLSNVQEQAVLQFHRNFVAWSHNVIHMPSFIRECMGYRHTLALPNIGWLSLYYAVLSLSFLYMPDGQTEIIGLPHGHALCQSFYDLIMESLHAAELATNNTLCLIQAICVILPCCHALGDSKRIMVLLSMATCQAQIMQVHRLQPDTDGSELVDPIGIEIRKRVWAFLQIQDMYLITFKKAHSIVAAHCTTPIPRHWDDDEISSASAQGTATALPLSCPTQSTYQLLQLRLNDIRRNLFDKTSALQATNGSLDLLYKCVLEADEQLTMFCRQVPEWLWQSPTGEAAAVASRTKSFASSVCYAFRITLLHQHMQIHRSFFCRGTSDKRFHYSFHSCLEAARAILREYTVAQPEETIECWTIPAHVLSACKIVFLKGVFTNGEGLALGVDRFMETHDQQLMQRCLHQLQSQRNASKIVDRGLKLMECLREKFSRTALSPSNLGYGEIARLVSQVEAHVENARWPNAQTDDNENDMLDMIDEWEASLIDRMSNG